MKRLTQEWWRSLRPEQVGKEAERLVEDMFKDKNTRSDFAWYRFPDAKAARGFLKAAPADYLISDSGEVCFIELKALKHLTRLPKDRVTQLPTLKKFAAAGTQSIVLVFHYLSNEWRAINTRHLDLGQPSWDLSAFPAFDSPYQALFGSAA